MLNLYWQSNTSPKGLTFPKEMLKFNKLAFPKITLFY